MRTRSHNRLRNARKLCKRFLVITDGIITEQGYFERVKRLTRDSIKIVSRSSKDIDKLVELAIKMKKNSDYDVVAIVCDIDQRLQSEKSKNTLIGAIANARKNGIMMCLSHESFEVWLLAHVGQIKSNMKSREQAQRLALKKGIVKGRDGKEIVVEKITKESIKAAVAEVQRLRGASGNNIIANAPMTDVDKLVSVINLS